MDLTKKLSVLADAAKYDASCASSGTSKRSSAGSRSALGSTEGSGICHSYAPDGRCISLLKILLTNFCIYDCQYCINRKSSNVQRARFTPAEVVRLTLDFYRRNYIEGLFLSSGIIQNPDYTMEQLITVARELREKHEFRGYIHLKTIPNASQKLIEEAGRWADRISINLELATQEGLDQLAPEKNLAAIGESMGGIKARIDESRGDRSVAKAPEFAPAGQSTQMIVGATDTPDATILSRATSLYDRYKLRRVYYSAYSPIPDAAAALPPIRPPLVREHRLYQADWLVRFYGFQAGELTTAEVPNLDLDVDPKLAWALRHREVFPIDLSKASRFQLLRIPGIGAGNVSRILAIRRWHPIRLDDLLRLKVALKRALPFIITADHKPRLRELDSKELRSKLLPVNRQLDLFAMQISARTGDL